LERSDIISGLVGGGVLGQIVTSLVPAITEARTKDDRIPIVIGEGTAQRAKEKFATMEIDRIQVKGKTEPETVFTVLGRTELGRDPNFQELHALTIKMLQYYREQNWTQALDALEPCRKAGEGFGIGALPACLPQASRRLRALRLHRTIRRDVGSAMAACVSSWVRVREIVSIVRPR
jgi:hypothetical protein